MTPRTRKADQVDPDNPETPADPASPQRETPAGDDADPDVPDDGLGEARDQAPAEAVVPFGATNLGMTQAERMANVDDGAVRADGRLHGRYHDDVLREEADRLRELAENADPSGKAAQVVRDTAANPTPAVGADQLGREALPPGVVDPDSVVRWPQGEPSNRVLPTAAERTGTAEQSEPVPQ